MSKVGILAVVAVSAACAALAEPKTTLFSFRSNSGELLSLAGQADGGWGQFSPTIAHCPADGGCRTVFVPAGATLYRTDGGWLAVPP
jgi:hypothetical protein